MTGAYMEPETGDLNAARSKIADIKSMATPVQHSLLFNRRGCDEQVLLCIYHYDDVQQLHLVVFEGDPAFPKIKVGKLSFLMRKRSSYETFSTDQRS